MVTFAVGQDAELGRVNTGALPLIRCLSIPDWYCKPRTPWPDSLTGYLCLESEGMCGGGEWKWILPWQQPYIVVSHISTYNPPAHCTVS